MVVETVCRRDHCSLLTYSEVEVVKNLLSPTNTVPAAASWEYDFTPCACQKLFLIHEGYVPRTSVRMYEGTYVL